MNCAGIIEYYDEPPYNLGREHAESLRLWRGPRKTVWRRARPGWETGREWYSRIEGRFPDLRELFRPVRAERAYTALCVLGLWLPPEVARAIVRRALWPRAAG